MSTAGPNSPTSAQNVAGLDTDWSNPTNCFSSNDLRATAALAATAVSDALEATGFGFSIPTGSTINGITLEVERSRGVTAGAVQDNTVELLKAGSVVGNDKAAVGAWPSSDTYATYGGSSDLWGTTWTAAEVNASNFGVWITAFETTGTDPQTARVDHVRITIDYTAPARSFSPGFVGV